MLVRLGLGGRSGDPHRRKFGWCGSNELEAHVPTRPSARSLACADENSSLNLHPASVRSQKKSDSCLGMFLVVSGHKKIAPRTPSPRDPYQISPLSLTVLYQGTGLSEAIILGVLVWVEFSPPCGAL